MLEIEEKNIQVNYETISLTKLLNHVRILYAHGSWFIQTKIVLNQKKNNQKKFK